MLRIRFAILAACVAVSAVGCEVKFNAGPVTTPVSGEYKPDKFTGSGASPDTGNQNPKEDPAEVALKKLNGRVKRDESQPGKPVVEVRLFEQKITDDDLKELAQFPNLKRVEFSGEKVTGTGLAALTKLPIEELHIGFCRGLTNDGLKEIGKIKTLRVLILPQGKFDDDGMKQLAELTNLEELTVSYGVNDVGMYVCKNFKKLRKVNANNCGVSDGAMKALLECPELRVLELYGSKVTDLGYSYIGKMSKLEELRTSYNITDKGVAELGKLEKLRKLDVWNSSVTIKGIRALPNLKQLKDLEISTWNIKAEEAAALRDELPDCNVRFKK
jgi:hypothetical protein